jgi:ribosomal protein S18 acetylase RimI-like enzyme/predicted ester cyclase
LDYMIRELRDGDAHAYLVLRREALLESPLAFASSPEDDVASSVEAVRELLQRSPESVLFGAFQNHLIGAVGLYRDRHLKSSHKAHLWGMYVMPGHRRQGVGSELLDAALRHAGRLSGVSWIHLCVTSAAGGAQRLYERAGFRVWGTEPDALRHDGETVVDYHMALHLEPGAGQPIAITTDTTSIRAAVQSFYADIWNRHDKSKISVLLHPHFTFRGSLGQHRTGHDEFASYVDFVHNALDQYRCDILDLVVENQQAFGRMRFHGIHRGDFLGYRPTGKLVEWTGAALFTFWGDKIQNVWVLGDIHGLLQLLKRQEGG